jgi:DNA topoisomerase-1
VYIDPNGPGCARIRRGKGFSYHHPDGSKIDDTETLHRMKSLGIPPSWQEVWICPNPTGHLQATGLDQQRRKQYLYHTEWIAYRKKAKFSKMKDFGLVLPHIRRLSYRLLQQSGWGKEKVLALVIQMMDAYHIRIGNDYYKAHHETFGLTTLRRKHLDFEQGVGRLEYKAKSGKYRKISMANNHLVNLVKKCAELPGYEIFKYRDQHKDYQRITSQEVNDFLHHIAGEQFSSKDFRTWGGTSLAVEKEDEARRIAGQNDRRKMEPTLVKLVSEKLGNTQAICRKYYIHPEVLKKVVEGKSPEFRHRPEALRAEDARLLSDSECTVLNMI